MNKDGLEMTDQGWWDKYRVSLHELDVQVVQAEAAMKACLVELGYE